MKLNKSVYLGRVGLVIFLSVSTCIFGCRECVCIEDIRLYAEKNPSPCEGWLKCQVSIVRFYDDTMADVTFINESDKEIPIAKWTLLMEEELLWEPFEIIRGGRNVPYEGELVRRARPKPEDFYILQPGESVTSRVLLELYYYLYTAGEYSITYDGSYFLPDTDQVCVLRSPPVKFSVPPLEELE
ncbi:MAG: hypothetical protein JSW23_01645 [Planctomycetota bacterium]|nr:MAG: hypothetical protein JSW23_01645 [Planctomycetota bacterium]